MKISINIRGVDKTIKSLEEIKKLITTVEPELDIVGRWVMSVFAEDVFRTSGSILGEPWQQLSSRYLAFKAKRYPGRGILERTGALKGGWKLQTWSARARVYNDVPYAKYHHSKEGRKSNLPRRVLGKITPEIADQIKVRFKSSIEARLRKIL